MSAFSFGNPNFTNFKFDPGDMSEGQANLTWDAAANWDSLWTRVMNQLGVTNQSSNFYDWMRGQSGEAQRQAKTYGALNQNATARDFLNQYVPGLAEQFGLQSAQSRGENPNIVGRPRFLG